MLQVNGFDGLKINLVAVVIVVMAVTFLGHAVTKRVCRLRSAAPASRIPTSYSKFVFLLREATMLVTDKGQVTIPKHIRTAAGVTPGSEVEFSLEGRRIVITPVASGVREDRRAKLRAAAARVRGSLSAEFRQLGADEIMRFIRGDELAKRTARSGRR